MKINITTWQKVLIAFVCFAIAIAGFMLKLPPAFRQIDKELHAAFYFLAAAFLNLLFAGTKLVRHAVIFVSLYLFGMAIEYSQAYSNRFFSKRIHGRFDPEDVEWNLKGLIAFSVFWLLGTIVILVFKKVSGKKETGVINGDFGSHSNTEKIHKSIELHQHNNDKTATQRIAHIALVVRDYDEAIKFYTEQLEFSIVEDTRLTDEKRWILLAPPGAKECCLLLAKAANEKQEQHIGNQTGGRVFLFLFTDNFWRDYNKMVDKKINFISQPRQEPYGTVAIFEDLYGNQWDLLEPKNNNKGLLS